MPTPLEFCNWLSDYLSDKPYLEDTSEIIEKLGKIYKEDRNVLHNDDFYGSYRPSAEA